MEPEILTEIFPRRKAIIALEIAQRCSVEVLKLPSMAQKVYLIWGILPTELKGIVSPTLFKKKIREWAPKNCPCRLCKTYVQNIGFV